MRARLATPQLLGERRRGRDGDQPDPAAQLLGQRGQQLAVPPHHRGGVVEVVEDRAADHDAALADRVAAEGEGGDDAEVAAATAQRPEQVPVRALAGGDERAVGEDHVGGEQVVDRQPEPPGQVADASPEGQPADAGGGDEPGRRRHPEADGGVVDVAPGAAAVDADGAARGVDGDAVHRRQVDDERVVPHAEPGGVVRPAADGDGQVVRPGEPDAGDDVGGVAAPGHGRRPLVDHGVVDGARLVVAGVGRRDQLTAQGGLPARRTARWRWQGWWCS